ncbi:hypothetical protein NDU88_002094 [Pleurodeles waltl]|uniref:Uncharacterized protein n=1 Tax=Pleurodeles waltl TaxID=8319 RepID=A0AAV7MLP9_PLEWA|nr:hypothetical protein NDU88_002094 [Pleurodeles waltl]
MVDSTRLHGVILETENRWLPEVPSEDDLRLQGCMSAGGPALLDRSNDRKYQTLSHAKVRCAPGEKFSLAAYSPHNPVISDACLLLIRYAQCTIGKDTAAKGDQQFTAQHAGGGSQCETSGPPGTVWESSGAQILMAIEASGQAVQAQIAAIAVNVNLLRTDLRAVGERSVATEKQVNTMQTDLDALKDTVATLEAKTCNLKMRMKYAE